MTINPIVILILCGLIAVVLIATVGAIASRKFNFRYTLLSFVSLLLYIVIAYWVSKEAGLPGALIATAVIGLFDSTVGWDLCLRFNANLADEEAQEVINIPTSIRVMMMLLVALVCGGVGHLLANN